MGVENAKIAKNITLKLYIVVFQRQKLIFKDLIDLKEIIGLRLFPIQNHKLQK